LKFLSIIQLTFRESLAKKTFIAFMGISTLTCLLFMFALNLDIVDGMKSSVKIFGQEATGTINVKEMIWGLEGGLAVALFTAGIFMALFATSSLVPTLLQPGFIDLFVSKPISRFTILAGRYVGGVAIAAFNILYLIFFSWLILSIKTGFWNWSFLLGGVLIVLTFAILYSIMTLLGLLTRSGPFSLMITYLIIFFSPLLIQRNKIYALLSSKIYGYLLDGLYYFLPKPTELGDITQEVVRGAAVASWMPLWTSLFFAGVMLAVSGFIFQKKNF
jgi:ABC-type transport system involved in multi-copper enzyme maturation permease subunit